MDELEKLTKKDEEALQCDQIKCPNCELWIDLTYSIGDYQSCPACGYSWKKL